MKEMTVAQFAEYTGMDNVTAAGFLGGAVHLLGVRKVGSVERKGERGRRAVLFGIPASIRIDFAKLDLPIKREVKAKKGADAPVAAVAPVAETPAETAPATAPESAPATA